MDNYYLNQTQNKHIFGLTGSDVEPVFITRSQLLVLAQLDKVHPVRHLQLS